MGINDYIDFVQRNGQCLEPVVFIDEDEEDEYSPDSYGSSEAVLVRVPISFTKRDILSWPLTEFAKFPIIKCGLNFINIIYKILNCVMTKRFNTRISIKSIIK